MKEKIKEVQQYFANKILNGDYNIRNISQYTIRIVIDNEYNFTLWVANDGLNFGTYESVMNFMNIQFNEEDKIRGYEKCNPMYRKFLKTELIEQKRKELEQLEKEL